MLVHESASGAQLPACPGLAPSLVGDYGGEFAAEDPTCGCSCGDAEGVTCPSTATLRTATNQCLSINPSPVDYPYPVGCSGTGGKTGWHELLAPNANVASASCAPQPVEDIPEPTFANQIRACENSATLPACSAEGTPGVCSPPATIDYRVCIYNDGESSCPAPYEERILAYDGVDDTRDCTTCACGTVEGSCEGTLNFASACSGLPILYDSISVHGCKNLSAGSASVATLSLEPGGSCTPTQSVATGDATPSGAVSFCCLPL
jgi:hypothetical protein